MRNQKIIYNICKSNNIPCPFVEKYIFQREEILNEVMTTYNVTHKDAKFFY